MSTVPSYLLLSRHSVFYFRIVVPEVIRPLFPQREIRRSLQTRCRREALIRGRELLLQVRCSIPKPSGALGLLSILCRVPGRQAVSVWPVGPLGYVSSSWLRLRRGLRIKGRL